MAIRVEQVQLRVFRSLRRAPKGVASGHHELFEKSSIKNFSFLFDIFCCRMVCIRRLAAFYRTQTYLLSNPKRPKENPSVFLGFIAVSFSASLLLRSHMNRNPQKHRAYSNISGACVPHKAFRIFSRQHRKQHYRLHNALQCG